MRNYQTKRLDVTKPVPELAHNALETLQEDLASYNGELLGILMSGIFGPITQPLQESDFTLGDMHWRGMAPEYSVLEEGCTWECFVYPDGNTVLVDMATSPSYEYHMFIDEA